MAISVTTRIVCDSCNRAHGGVAFQEENVLYARSIAYRDGWITVKSPRLRAIDICPDCQTTKIKVKYTVYDILGRLQGHIKVHS